MAKRRAEYQLDRDGGHLEIEAELQKRDEHDSISGTGFNQGAIQGRKIAKLRTSKFGNAGTSVSQENPDTSNSNPVSSFAFTGYSKPSTASLPALTGDEDDNVAMFKAINKNFSQKINESIAKDPSCILSAICEKYLQYVKGNQPPVSLPKSISPINTGAPSFAFNSQALNAEKKPTPFANFKVNSAVTSTETTENSNEKGGKHNPFGQFKLNKPAAEKASITELSSSGSECEDDKKSVEIKGPQFTLSTKPTIKNPAFAFGEALKKKQAEEVDSDDSDIAEEPKGPTFNFTGTIKDSAFKISKPLNQKTSVTAAPIFSFGSNKSAETAVEEPFKPKNDVPVLSFGSSKAVDASEKKEIKPPVFSLSAASGASKDELAVKPSSTPVFSFGAKKDDEAKPTSMFNFGINKQDGDVPKPTFSFDLKKESTNDEIKSQEPKTETKSQFSFNLNNTKSDVQTAKPTFNFGKLSTSTTAASTSKIGFGNTTSFSFAKKDDENTGSSIATETQKPNFSFNLPFNQNNTSSPASGTQTVINNSVEVSEEKEDEAQKPTNLENNDEENENVLYTKKAKLMLFDPENKENPYVTRGLGMFKILQSIDDKKKVRFVLRSEGMGNVLLNTYIIPSVTYSQFPNQPSAVKLPVVNSETKKFETFLLRVKTGDDGKDIVDVINKAKEDMK
ncbi:hypothetical protein QEN19_003825 [Hanseniaspora menglaensis]